MEDALGARLLIISKRTERDESATRIVECDVESLDVCLGVGGRSGIVQEVELRTPVRGEGVRV
jgi:hypothetical protein